MDWPIEGKLSKLSLGSLGELKPEEVLYEFELPCIFTTRDVNGGLLLAYLSEDLEDQRLYRYLVVSTSNATIEGLKVGGISVSQAFTQGSIWIADLDERMKPAAVYGVKAEDLPADALPAPGTMLWACLEPVLKVRLEGETIKIGNIPSAVLAQAGEIASKALKPIFDLLTRERREDLTGRPPSWLRNLYGLSLQRFAFGSLELHFSGPALDSNSQIELFDGLTQHQKPAEIIDKGIALLRKGLDWASSQDREFDGSDEERLAVLESLKILAPSTHGPVSRVSLSGTYLGSHSDGYQINLDSAKRIRSLWNEIKARTQTQVATFQGLIRDLDIDKLSFILRWDSVGPQQETFVLEDDSFLEFARDAHYQQWPVSVVGKKERVNARIWTVIGLEFNNVSERTAKK